MIYQNGDHIAGHSIRIITPIFTQPPTYYDPSLLHFWPCRQHLSPGNFHSCFMRQDKLYKCKGCSIYISAFFCFIRPGQLNHMTKTRSSMLVRIKVFAARSCELKIVFGSKEEHFSHLFKRTEHIVCFSFSLVWLLWLKILKAVSIWLFDSTFKINDWRPLYVIPTRSFVNRFHNNRISSNVRKPINITLCVNYLM